MNLRRLKLKELPPISEYAFLVGEQQGCPFLIAKELVKLRKNPLLIKDAKRDCSDGFSISKNLTSKLLIPKGARTPRSDICPIGNPYEIHSSNPRGLSDFANYLAGGFIVKGIVNPAEKQVFQRCLNTISGTNPFLLKICAESSDSGMCARNESSWILAACHNGPTGDIMVQTSQPKRSLTPVSSGHIFKDAHEFVKTVELVPPTSRKKLHNVGLRCLKNSIHVCESLTCGDRLYGPVPVFTREQVFLVEVVLFVKMVDKRGESAPTKSPSSLQISEISFARFVAPRANHSESRIPFL
ncbi:hypothetical protein Tco_1056206 [Tanacetum coccineum]|uniref:Uncharacterized protein n=1 Tax=Tanacetum coccineum TaxID=301880 RepID=A0ABQ5H229_9ASTR